jgi:hypothetical protein
MVNEPSPYTACWCGRDQEGRWYCRACGARDREGAIVHAENCPNSGSRVDERARHLEAVFRAADAWTDELPDPPDGWTPSDASVRLVLAVTRAYRAGVKPKP